MKRILVAGGLLLTALTSANGQWEIQNSHTTANLRGIHNLGNGIAWASGANGTVLRTADNGTRWQICSIPLGAENLDFRGIQGFDRDSAIVMSSGKGDLSRLYKTTDGCQSWKLLLTNPDKEGFWDAIQFEVDFLDLLFHRTPPRRSSGVLLGDPVDGKFVIYTTLNSGDTWGRWGPSKASHPAVARMGESVFAASNSAVVAPGDNGRFAFVTGGSGGSRLFEVQSHSPFDLSSWEAFSLTNLHMRSDATAGAFSIAFRRQPGSTYVDVMVVGGDYNNPTWAKGTAAFIPSRAAGGPFSRGVTVSAHPPNGYRSAVAYDPNVNTWIAVGPSGTDISTDDGRNWRALKPKPTDELDADKNWSALSLPFVVGPNGRIGRLETGPPAH
jgi:photosystem II stability/assembly factor-like uncharacterized protein